MQELFFKGIYMGHSHHHGHAQKSINDSIHINDGLYDCRGHWCVCNE